MQELSRNTAAFSSRSGVLSFMLEHLTTEARNPASEDLDGLSALEIVQLINSEDAKVAAAVAEQADVIAQAIDVIAERLARGGRLIYIGAGTSGRLGVLDAVECPPTFNTHPSQVVGVIAGGYTALTSAVEGAEDRPDLAVEDLKNVRLTDGDVVVGIATSGRTPYVIGSLGIRPERRRVHDRPELQSRPADRHPLRSQHRAGRRGRRWSAARLA